MRRLFFIFLFAITSFSQIPAIEPGVSEELAKWRAAHYSNISYKLNLTLEKMSPVLKGSMEIRVTVSEPPASAGGQSRTADPTPIILDWRNIPGHEKDSTVANVLMNGIPANGWAVDNDSFRVEGNEISYYLYGRDHLIFRDGVKMGENVIKLDFTSPILTSGSAITRYIDKEDGSEYIYSLFVPSDASTAFPVFDQPDLKARFSLYASVPMDWTLVSNQIRVDPPTHPARHNGSGYQQFSFDFTKPISSYVFAFAAGPFSEETAGGTVVPGAIFPDEDIPKPGVGRGTRVFVRKSQAEKFKPHAAEVFRLNREAVKYLETYFDYKFPWPKYDLVLIPEFPFGGMEHAGATFLREQSVIFPQEPTKNDVIARARVIFHEAAHQWFGDCVTMKWFDDLWLKEGFAEFMAYKTLEKVIPDSGAWKDFYERNKQAAYATDSTKGTTAIYQPIKNLSAAKSAYGNIVYRKAPSFLRQAEFYLGEDKFQTAVRAFLKKHEFGNAGWEDLVKEFEAAAGEGLSKEFPNVTDQNVTKWAKVWVEQRGLGLFRINEKIGRGFFIDQSSPLGEFGSSNLKFQVLIRYKSGVQETEKVWMFLEARSAIGYMGGGREESYLIFPNYQDYGYGIFLLDDKSRDYVLKNIQNEKDDFLRTMMWGSLWDSVREAELDPKDYVELVIKNIGLEKDEGTIQTLLSRVTTAMNYYMSDREASAGGQKRVPANRPAANAAGSDLRSRLENLLIDKIQNASTQGQRITYYRAFLNIASTDKSRGVLKEILKAGSGTAKSPNPMTLKTKDKFDIVTRLIILGDAEAPALLATLEKTETSDDARRYAYAAKAGIPTVENKAKYWNDFVGNKDISENWIEAAIDRFNSISHSGLTRQYLTQALTELPSLKRSRKIFFVNDWLESFIGGQKSEEALAAINKFLRDNPTLDNDLRLKILENSDLIERAVKIRAKYGKN